MTQSPQESIEQKDNITNLSPEIDLDQKLEKLGIFSLNILRSMVLLRLIGYGFLVLFCLDLADIFIPPRFLNPAWEFETLGQIVERVAIPFIALALIFYGGNYLRRGWEYVSMTILSWLCLVVGVIFILVVPLGIINTFRLETQITTTIQRVANQQLETLQNVENRLQQIKNADEMRGLIQQITNQNPPNIENEQQLGEAKAQLSKFITENRSGIQTQSAASIAQRRKTLIKQSVKWNLGALISGALFISTWQMTKWARQKDVTE